MTRQKILIVEDNEHNLYMMVFLLEKSGFDTLEATNGPQALTMAVSELPDLVILDVQLPGMDGFSVARKLRALPCLDAVPIVAVTSHAMVGDRERILAAGADLYIEKPIDPSTFVASIRACLATGNQTRGDPGPPARPPTADE